ncbi:MAG: glutamate--tRNA ligase, partial [Patescibacteria group bacterium]
QQLNKQPSKYDGLCCNKSDLIIQELLKNKTQYVVRLKIPNGSTTFTDLIHGQVTVDNSNIDDQIILKSDGFPTYHLANVVDDHLMKISHVIRGEEWLPSTPKHIILYNAFSWQQPIWAHLPNVLNKNRAKLSKRKDGESVWLSTYIKSGYLSQALVNFLALLGWHPQDNQELFTIEQLITKFDIKRMQKAGAIFDVDKLHWFNSKYIKILSTDELDKRLKNFYPKLKYDTIELTKLLQTRLTTLAEASLLGEFYFKDKITFNPSLMVPQGSNVKDIIEILKQGIETLKNINDWKLDSIKSELMRLIDIKKFTKKDLLWTLRIALTGQEQSPDVYEVLVALGKQRSLERIKNTIESL